MDGVQKSLADLGYTDVGLDDNWQACGTGENGTQFHDTAGNPLVNKSLFPDFKEMTDHGHSLGLSVGWYGNNCICHETSTDQEKFYAGDVNALVQYGFDGIKLDGCGAQLDLELYYNLINATGRPVTIENCHWGNQGKLDFQPTLDYCPFNFYRSSGDVAATYTSVLRNLASVTRYAQAGLSRPGCWAYPDMLEVGCEHGIEISQYYLSIFRSLV